MMFRLTLAQEEYVARNGFVVVPSEAFAGMAEAYESLKKRGLPIFVTTDALLHTAHLFFDYLLRALLKASPETAPAFMQSEAWARKQLNAALGAWAELRHDTILYIKQSYTSAPRGLFQSPPPLAYLEPCPQVYDRLGAMVAQMREQLDGWGRKTNGH